jgi:hypothetical protein
MSWFEDKLRARAAGLAAKNVDLAEQLLAAETDIRILERRETALHEEADRLDSSGTAWMERAEAAEARAAAAEQALRQAAMNLATARDTRWAPYNGEMPDKSLGEIAADWYALLFEQSGAQRQERLRGCTYPDCVGLDPDEPCPCAVTTGESEDSS